MKTFFMNDFTSKTSKAIGMIVLVMFIVSTNLLLVSCSEKKFDYTTACAKQDFASAHQVLHEMKMDISHKNAEMKNSERLKKLPGMYQEYINAVFYVYGEEMKYLLDQDNPQTEKRIKVLGAELEGEVQSLMTTFDGLANEFNLDMDKQLFYNLQENLMAEMTKLNTLYDSVKDVQNEDE